MLIELGADKEKASNDGMTALQAACLGSNCDVARMLIELGADDVAEEDGLTLFCSYENFEKIKKQLEGKGSKIEYAAVEWVAKEKMVVDDEVKAKVEALIEQVEEHDDVSSVCSNMGECI